MTQTLQALFAIVLLMTFSLGMQRNHVASQTGQVRSEVELRATGVATQLFDTFALLPFDGNGTVDSTSDFTPAAQFGGALNEASATDLDDLHDLTGTTTLTTGGIAMTYEWTVTVRYMQAAGGNITASANPTHLKEVELAILGPAGVTLTTNRIYSYNG